MTNLMEVVGMNLIQQITTMVVDRIYRYLQKIPVASYTHKGIIDVDNKTLYIQNDSVIADITKITPEVIVVSTPTTIDKSTNILVNDMNNIEMSLVATSLLSDPIPISHMEIYFNNSECVTIVVNDGICECCAISTIQYIDVVAVDVLNNRSEVSRIHITKVTPMILTPSIISPNTNIVNGSTSIPYMISDIKTIPYSTGTITTTWELKGADNRSLWSNKTSTNYTYGPSVSELESITKSSMYYMEIDHTTSVSANTITTFKNKIYYTSDTQGSIYMLTGDTSELISIPELRYCYKAMSTDLLIVFCSSLYVIYSLDGTTWYTIQHPTSITDISLYGDVIYMLDTSGNIIKYNATTKEYYQTIQTAITNARGCSVDELTLYLVTFDTAYSVDIRTGDISKLYTVEYGNFKDISIVNNTIIINNTNTIYYFNGKWSSIEFDNDSIIKVVVRDDKVFILMSSGAIYMANSKMSFTTLNVSSRELIDMTMTNNVCFITDNSNVYKTNTIVPLSEPVTMYVKCVSTDARYAISDTITHTYQYKLT